jgi:hypothetical protein
MIFQRKEVRRVARVQRDVDAVLVVEGGTTAALASLGLDVVDDDGPVVENLRDTGVGEKLLGVLPRVRRRE